MSSRLLFVLKRLINYKSYVGTIMMELFRGAPSPEDVAGEEGAGDHALGARRVRRRLGFYPALKSRALTSGDSDAVAGTGGESSGGAATSVAAAATSASAGGAGGAVDGSAKPPRHPGMAARGTKRSRDVDSEYKGEVEEAEEKTMHVEDDVPVARGPGGGAGASSGVGASLHGDDDEAMDGLVQTDAEPSTALFDRLVCLSLHPMYRSAPRHMRQLYNILGVVADQMSGYCARQAALDERAVRDYVLVRSRLPGSRSRAVWCVAAVSCA